MPFWTTKKSIPSVVSVEDETIVPIIDTIDVTDEVLPPSTEVSERLEESYDYSAAIEDFRVYLAYRIPTSFAAGGITGAAVGYYVGDVMALYGYTYGFGLCFTSTLFYSGAYGMRCIRKTDDFLNHATSGALCAGLLGHSVGGRIRGAKYAAVGAIGGAIAKFGGDFVYSSFRSSWIDYRRFRIENCKPRILQTRPKMRRPMKNEEFSPRETYSLVLFPPAEPNTDLTDMSKEPTRPTSPK